MRVFVPGDAGAQQGCSRWPRASGVQVRHLRPSVPTLEDVFARAVGEDVGTMPIHDQGYRRYGGTRAATGRAWQVIARAGIRTLIGKRAFLGLMLVRVGAVRRPRGADLRRRQLSSRRRFWRRRPRPSASSSTSRTSSSSSSPSTSAPASSPTTAAPTRCRSTCRSR